MDNMKYNVLVYQDEYADEILEDVIQDLERIVDRINGLTELGDDEGLNDEDLNYE